MTKFSLFDNSRNLPLLNKWVTIRLNPLPLPQNFRKHHTGSIKKVNIKEKHHFYVCKSPDFIAKKP